jgi:hypothetical protein
MLNRTAISVIVFVLVTFLGNSLKAEDEIGIFFDEAGTINCLPDSTNFPIVMQSYLILKNCSDAGGVGGWEAAISFSGNGSLIGAEINGDAINVGTGNEFIVGLGTPLAQATSIILATFTMLFMESSEVNLFAPEQNSIEGELGPVLLSGGDMETLIPVTYSYGDPFHSVLTLGIPQCPTDSLEQVSVGDVQEEAEIVSSPDEEYFRNTSQTTSKQDLDFTFFQNWHLGGVMRVLEKEAECIESGGLRMGAGHLTLQVQDVFWGCGEFQVYDFWVDGVSLSGCVGYQEDDAFIQYSDINIGDEIVVFGYWEEGMFWAKPYSVYSVDEVFSSLGGGDYLNGSLKEVERKNSLKNQVKNSDLVVQLFPSRSGRGEMKVGTVFVGDSVKPGEVISIKSNKLNSVFDLETDGGISVFCCLVQSPEGEWDLINGFHSFFIHEDRGWFSPYGYPLNIVDNNGVLVGVKEGN